MPALPTHPDETPILLFNPSRDDFTHPFDGKPYTLPSRKIVTHPKWLADHLAKHLASKLATLDSEKIHFEERMKKWYKQIYVTI